MSWHSRALVFKGNGLVVAQCLASRGSCMLCNRSIRSILVGLGRCRVTQFGGASVANFLCDLGRPLNSLLSSTRFHSLPALTVVCSQIPKPVAIPHHLASITLQLLCT